MTSHVTKQYNVRSSVNVKFPEDFKFNVTVKKDENEKKVT